MTEHATIEEIATAVGTRLGMGIGHDQVRAEAVLQGMLELRAMRGRLTRVTVNDVALLLALVDAALPLAAEETRES